MSIIHDYASIARTMNCNKPSKLERSAEPELYLICCNCSNGIPPSVPRFPISSSPGGYSTVGVICPNCCQTNTVS